MNDGSHSDEELLALLQPPTLPEEFDFDSTVNMKDTSDEDDNNMPLPGAAPPAPMAPMKLAQAALMVQAAPVEPMDVDMPDSQPQNTQVLPSANPVNGDTNVVGSSQAQAEDDEDEIAYEPVKTPSRGSRSTKPRTSTSATRTSAIRPGSRRKPVSSRSKSQPRKHSVDVEVESQTDSKVEPKTESKTEPRAEIAIERSESPARELKSESPKSPPPLDFEVVISPLPPNQIQEYKPIPPGDEIYRVLSRIPTGVPGETWLSVEFEDGHIDQVAFDQFSSYPNSAQALANYNNPKDMGGYPEDDDVPLGYGGQTVKRKVTFDPDYNESKNQLDEDEIEQDVLDEDEDEDEDIISGPRRRHPSKRRRLQRSAPVPAPTSNVRRSGRNRDDQRPAYKLPPPTLEDDEEDEDEDSDFGGRRRKALRKKGARLDDDADELGADSDGLLIVTSDVVPVKRRRGRPAFPKRRRLGDDDDLEVAPRRSGRANQSNKTVYLDDNLDEDMYAPEEEKLPSVPKISGAKEVFPRLQNEAFTGVHATTCGTCGNNADSPNKGMMIYCQGCSNAYHKICLGFRTTREHVVTKVGPFQFVLQCRDCVGSKKKKDALSPNLSICQVCKVKGRACTAFAPKLPAVAEAKLREENDGEDPIHRVPQNLINNPDNVLFRCTSCHCAYHFEHLPAIGGKNSESTVRQDRIESYAVDWKCKGCLDMQYKITALVAWRPIDRNKYAGMTTLEVPEDAKEYLIKWDTRSYAHCEWRSGSWVYGRTTAVMRKAFPKRNNGENLHPKFDEKEAIPEEYLLVDVILNVTFKGKVHFENKEKDKNKVLKVEQALVKFQGLDYSEVVWDEPPEPDKKSSRWIAFSTAYTEFLNGKHFQSEPLIRIKDRLRDFRRLDSEDIDVFVGLKDTEMPAQPLPGLTDKLMKYQVQGLNWLKHNFHQQRSVVLADEMGLGKTIQVIALIASLVFQGPKCYPFLVVVPNSTCPNWRREIKKWAPDLRTVTYHGGREPQKLAYQHELFPNGAREMKAHVVIMSYDSAQDPETRSLFKSIQWVGLIVDEGQRLKNDANLLYAALLSMKIPWRLLLTGTPLQNNKRELFNLIQFLDPSKNAVQLDEKYADITSENISELHEMIRPYFLRRTKAGVLKKVLPPMSQIILPVSMSVVQEKLCKSIMAKNPELIRAIFANTKLKSNERSSLNNILMQLRKCLGHPFLYSGAVEERNVSEEVLHQNLVSASSKLVLLEQMLPKLQERGHRVLIFSQFLGMLDIVEDFLTGIGFMYQRLDGTMSSLQKQKRIDAFNEPESEYFAFLLSTRAGGVGINLATADTVIILDPDFNPHQDMQALSRAHRIGQKKKVLCFQLMTKSSVEEKIMQIGRKKMALDHALIETMDRKEDDPGEDLESILTHGAEALFNNNNEKEVIKYDAEAIDKLLDRSNIRHPESTEGGDGGKAAEKLFAYAQVWQNKTGGLSDDMQVDDSPNLDISVWDKILKEREAEAQRLAELNKEVLGRGSRRRQAVKYNGHGPAIHDPDEAGDMREGSDIDEDFISNDSSSSDSDEAEASDMGAITGSGPAITGSGPTISGGPEGPKIEAESQQVPKHRRKADVPGSQQQQPQHSQLPAQQPGPAVTVPKRRGRPRQHPLPGTDQPGAGAPVNPAHHQSDPRAGNTSQQPRVVFDTPLLSSGRGAGSGIPSGYAGSAPGMSDWYEYIPGQQSLQHSDGFAPRVNNGFLPSTGGRGPLARALAANSQTQLNNGMVRLSPSQVPQATHQAQNQQNPIAHPSRPFQPSNFPQRTGNTQQAPVSFAQCGKCQLYHAQGANCPSLRTPAQISIALDDVKNLSGGDPVMKKLNRTTLQRLLSEAKTNRQAGRTSSSPAPAPQSVQAPQPPQQQTVQQSKVPQPVQSVQPHPQRVTQQLPPAAAQQQVQLSVPAEENSDAQSTDSDSTESEAELEEGAEAGTEAGSEPGSEPGSGSSDSESGKDVMAAILSR